MEKINKAYKEKNNLTMMNKSWRRFFYKLAAASLLFLSVCKEDLDNLPYLLDQMPGTE